MLGQGAKYRQQAEYCREQARKTADPELQEAWLRLASDWLSMIPTGAGNFDAEARRLGTGQKDSTSSH